MRLATITAALIAAVLLLKFTLWVAESVAEASILRIEIATNERQP